MKYVVLLSTVTLAACGGSGGGGQNVQPEPLTFQELVDETSRLTDLISEQGTSVTPLGQIPPSGRASYQGTWGFTTFQDEFSGAIGVATIDTYFDSNTWSGEVSQFVDRDDNVYNGTVSFDGSINRAGGGAAQLSALGGGDLTSPDGDVIRITTSMTGNFRGPNAGFMSGTFSGQANGDILEGGSAGILGDFVAEQQETFP